MPLHVLWDSLSCLHDYMSELLGMVLFSLYLLSFTRHKRTPCACPWAQFKLGKNKIHVQERAYIRQHRHIIDLRLICFNIGPQSWTISGKHYMSKCDFSKILFFWLHEGLLQNKKQENNSLLAEMEKIYIYLFYLTRYRYI